MVRKERRTMKKSCQTTRIIGMLGLAVFLGACDDFIAPTDDNPNAIPDATLSQLFVASQVNSYLMNGGTISRITSVWTQQQDGVARQWQTLAQYEITEDDFEDMQGLYTGGGLVDLRKARTLAESEGNRLFEGILKVHEAWLMGLGASIWGDLPYSDALDTEDDPELDSQADLYASLQSLLDEAVADLEDGSCPAPCPAGSDFNFGGDAASWLAVAHSLKARLHIHWAEVEGAARYQAALDEAQLGISSAAGDWTQKHSGARTEANPWFLFQENRAGDIAAAATLVDLMNGGTPDDPSDDDPRLSIYFTTGSGAFAGQYVGSPIGNPANDPGTQASQLNVPAQSAFPQPILTCAETQLIAAEASFQGGDEAGARTAGQAALDCEEARWATNGFEIDLSDQRAALDAASGDALFEEIMTQKFIALFLVPETYNDWKRTCTPDREPAPGANEIPGRFLYSTEERQANSNIPPPGQQPARNANDPAGCP